MSGRIIELAELSGPEIDELDPGRTLFVMAMSPLEVHGPHLPMGTDVWVAEELQSRTIEKVRESHPDFEFVVFPSYYLGSDTIPGSVEVDSRAVFHVLKASGEFLADRGFRYLLVLDNHGGPRHQIAAAKAVRKLYRKRGFNVIVPFLSFFRRMADVDPSLVEHVGAGRGACGDVEDSHAGLNETSLMLCARPDAVRPQYRELPRTAINQRRWPGLLLGLAGRGLKAIGLEDMGEDIAYAGVLLSWVTMKNPPNYIGEPCAATPEAGDRMLEAHSLDAAGQVEAVLRGEPPYCTPIGWSLRFIEPSR